MPGKRVRVAAEISVKDFRRAKKFEANLPYVREHGEELLRDHAGEYVALYGGELVDYDADCGALAGRVGKKYKDRAFMVLIEYIEKPETAYTTAVS